MDRGRMLRSRGVRGGGTPDRGMIRGRGMSPFGPRGRGMLGDSPGGRGAPSPGRGGWGMPAGSRGMSGPNDGSPGTSFRGRGALPYDAGGHAMPHDGPEGRGMMRGGRGGPPARGFPRGMDPRGRAMPARGRPGAPLLEPPVAVGPPRGRGSLETGFRGSRGGPTFSRGGGRGYYGDNDVAASFGRESEPPARGAVRGSFSRGRALHTPPARGRGRGLADTAARSTSFSYGGGGAAQAGWCGQEGVPPESYDTANGHAKRGSARGGSDDYSSWRGTGRGSAANGAHSTGGWGGQDDQIGSEMVGGRDAAGGGRRARGGFGSRSRGPGSGHVHGQFSYDQSYSRSPMGHESANQQPPPKRPRVDAPAGAHHTLPATDMTSSGGAYAAHSGNYSDYMTAAYAAPPPPPAYSTETSDVQSSVSHYGSSPAAAPGTGSYGQIGYSTGPVSQPAANVPTGYSTYDQYSSGNGYSSDKHQYNAPHAAGEGYSSGAYTDDASAYYGQQQQQPYNGGGW